MRGIGKGGIGLVRRQPEAHLIGQGVLRYVHPEGDTVILSLLNTHLFSGAGAHQHLRPLTAAIGRRTDKRGEVSVHRVVLPHGHRDGAAGGGQADLGAGQHTLLIKGQRIIGIGLRHRHRVRQQLHIINIQRLRITGRRLIKPAAQRDVAAGDLLHQQAAGLPDIRLHGYSAGGICLHIRHRTAEIEGIRGAGRQRDIQRFCGHGIEQKQVALAVLRRKILLAEEQHRACIGPCLRTVHGQLQRLLAVHGRVLLIGHRPPSRIAVQGAVHRTGAGGSAGRKALKILQPVRPDGIGGNQQIVQIHRAASERPEGHIKLCRTAGRRREGVGYPHPVPGLYAHRQLGDGEALPPVLRIRVTDQPQRAAESDRRIHPRGGNVLFSGLQLCIQALIGIDNAIGVRRRTGRGGQPHTLGSGVRLFLCNRRIPIGGDRGIGHLLDHQIIHQHDRALTVGRAVHFHHHMQAGIGVGTAMQIHLRLLPGTGAGETRCLGDHRLVAAVVHIARPVDRSAVNTQGAGGALRQLLHLIPEADTVGLSAGDGDPLTLLAGNAEGAEIFGLHAIGRQGIRQPHGRGAAVRLSVIRQLHRHAVVGVFCPVGMIHAGHPIIVVFHGGGIKITFVQPGQSGAGTDGLKGLYIAGIQAPAGIQHRIRIRKHRGGLCAGIIQEPPLEDEALFFRNQPGRQRITLRTGNRFDRGAAIGIERDLPQGLCLRPIRLQGNIAVREHRGSRIPRPGNRPADKLKTGARRRRRVDDRLPRLAIDRADLRAAVRIEAYRGDAGIARLNVDPADLHHGSAAFGIVVHLQHDVGTLLDGGTVIGHSRFPIRRGPGNGRKRTGVIHAAVIVVVIAVPGQVAHVHRKLQLGRGHIADRLIHDRYLVKLVLQQMDGGAGRAVILRFAGIVRQGKNRIILPLFGLGQILLIRQLHKMIRTGVAAAGLHPGIGTGKAGIIGGIAGLPPIGRKIGCLRTGTVKCIVVGLCRSRSHRIHRCAGQQHRQRKHQGQQSPRFAVPSGYLNHACIPFLKAGHFPQHPPADGKRPYCIEILS